MPATRGAGASELEGKERKMFVGEEGRAFQQVFGPGQCKHFQSFSLLQFLRDMIVTSWQELEHMDDAGSEKGSPQYP